MTNAEREARNKWEKENMAFLRMMTAARLTFGRIEKSMKGAHPGSIHQLKMLRSRNDDMLRLFFTSKEPNKLYLKFARLMLDVSVFMSKL